MAQKPPLLMAGDTIGIVSLGSPREAEDINRNIAFLQGLGINLVLGDNVYASSGFLAGTARQRASDLMNMYMNPEVKAILPTRGGTGVQGILPFLDYSFIAQNQNINSGYSDLTILLNVLYELSEQITFHSLLLLDFRPTTPAYNFDQFFTATSTLLSPRIIENPTGMPALSLIVGNVTGPLVGGNLTSFVGTLGTPFDIDTRGKVLFLEDVHEPINTIYRYIEQLRVAGKFLDC